MIRPIVTYVCETLRLEKTKNKNYLYGKETILRINNRTCQRPEWSMNNQNKYRHVLKMYE